MDGSKLEFFDLCGLEPQIRFSPHCWKTRMALAHKGVSFRTTPWRYSDKVRIEFSGQGAVPVIRHGNVAVSDSWSIALYLENAFPKAPPLFGDEAAVGLSLFVNAWVDTILIQAAARLAMPDVHALLTPTDKSYFRTTREQRFGITLEELVSDRPAKLELFRKELQPLRHLLGKQAFISGSEPRYADYCVFGVFMWIRCCSGLSGVEEGDPIAAWRNKMLDLFDGLARNAMTVKGARGPDHIA